MIYRTIRPVTIFFIKARSNDRSKYFAIISPIDNAKYIEKFFYCVHIKVALGEGTTTSSPEKVIWANQSLLKAVLTVQHIGTITELISLYSKVVEYINFVPLANYQFNRLL
jgi:hypothetical protein